MADEGGNCSCGRIQDGVDTQARVVAAAPSNSPIGVITTGVFGNRCGIDGSHFDEGGFCSNGHKIPV